MNDREELFLKTLKDLERKVESHDPYEILGASALIRKLLLDSAPLVDQVNQKYRMKICFELGSGLRWPKSVPEPSFLSVQDGIDPDTGRPGTPRRLVVRDEFLKTPVLLSEGCRYSIRDIVLFEANVMGGVHAGTPKNEKEEAIEKVNQLFSIGGYKTSLRQLCAIGRVVLKALAPLRDRIQRSP